MGCGASNTAADSTSPQKHSANNGNGNTNNKRQHAYDDDESEDSLNSDVNSVSSNKFTVATSTGHRYEHNAYTPGKAGNIDEEIERWKAKNRGELDKPDTSGTTTAEDFVFGDFKVDPGDVQKQRVERVNRVRTRRTSFTRTGSAGAKKPGAGEELMFNDFVVPMQVDEVDDPTYFFFHERKVPPGFRKLQKYALSTLVGHASRVKALAIAPGDGEYASAAIEDCHITLTSMSRDGEETGTFAGHQLPIISAVFSRDGRYLATSSRDNTVIVWYMSQKHSTNKQIRTLEHPSLPICVCFSHDGTLLITGSQDRVCRVWEVETKELIGTFEEHEGVVVCVAAVPGQAQAVSGGSDRIIRLWSTTAAPKPIRQFIGHDGVVISVSITPDGEKLLSNDDRACKMWNLSTGACVLNVTLDSLTSSLHGSHQEFVRPMPLPKHFVNRVHLPSSSLGLAQNGILGPAARNACKIGSNRSVFTLSCLCPGELSCSYFAVACTNRIVYIVSCASGHEELSFHVKASVFAINAGRDTSLAMGDIYGNCYVANLFPENYKKPE